MIDSGEDLHCIDCMTVLVQSNSEGLFCKECSRSYPLVHKIPVLTSRPNVLLRSHHEKLQESRLELSRRRNIFLQLVACCQASDRSRRIERMLDGFTCNLEVLETIMRPVADYVRNHETERLEAIDWILGHNIGWLGLPMLVYFYQDWAGTETFELVESLIVNALLDHRPDSKNIAILGSGACGIVKSSAPHFSYTYAVDLSLPALLLSQHLLGGESIRFFVESAGWRPVHLAPPALSAPHQIRLLAANVSSLPFSDSSISAIVTQYLMDIVGNPLAVAEEIARVLKPSGIWVNLSIAFGIPGDPPGVPRLEMSEMAAALESLGLHVITGELQQVNHLDVRGIRAGGHRQLHETHFMVARRRTGKFKKDLDFGHDSWWNQVPCLVPGRKVQLIHKRVYSSTGVTDLTELDVNRLTALPFGAVDLTDAILAQIDGVRTLREAWNRLSSKGVLLNEKNFRDVVQCFKNDLGVLTIL